jgi:hypothetical protein
VAVQALTCWICNNAVSLNECKFDEFGKPVHELCSVARIALHNGTRQQQSRPWELTKSGQAVRPSPEGD